MFEIASETPKPPRASQHEPPKAVVSDHLTEAPQDLPSGTSSIPPGQYSVHGNTTSLQCEVTCCFAALVTISLLYLSPYFGCRYIPKKEQKPAKDWNEKRKEKGESKTKDPRQNERC